MVETGILEIAVGVAAGGLGVSYLPKLTERVVTWLTKVVKKKYRKLKKEFKAMHALWMEKRDKRQANRVKEREMIQEIRRKLYGK